MPPITAHHQTLEVFGVVPRPSMERTALPTLPGLKTRPAASSGLAGCLLPVKHSSCRCKSPEMLHMLQAEIKSRQQGPAKSPLVAQDLARYSSSWGPSSHSGRHAIPVKEIVFRAGSLQEVAVICSLFALFKWSLLQSHGQYHIRSAIIRAGHRIAPYVVEHETKRR